MNIYQKIKENKKIVVNIFRVSGLLALFNSILPYPVMAQNQDAVTKHGFDSIEVNKNANSDLIDIAISVLNYAIGLIGLIAVVFLVYGGVLFITAGGDEGKVEKATKTITQALIGLVIVILAGVIVRFVMQRITATTA